MIYEAEAGESIEQAARRAIAKGCDKFLHNMRVYEVGLKYRQTDEWVAKTGETPAHATDCKDDDRKECEQFARIGVKGGW